MPADRELFVRVFQQPGAVIAAPLEGDRLGVEEGTYRLYNITLTDDRFVYELAGRFEISSDTVTVLSDATGLLGRYVASGPLTDRKRR